MTGIEFRVLGPVEILQDGERLGPTTAQQRCVLAMLLLDLGRVVSTGRLISALWATSPPVSALGSVRVHVTRLRKLLAADPTVELATVGEGWRLTSDPERVDPYRFRDLVARARSGPAEEAGTLLREGLSLWRGPALADVTGHWLTGAVAEGLEDERLAATEERLASDLRSGDDRGLVPELSVFAAEHPLRERPAQLLMSALHRSGRTAEGLEVFQRTRTRLIEELGIEPSALLRQEHQQLLNGSGDANTDASDGATLPRQLPGDVAVFAGREPQLSHLNDLLDRAEQDGRTLVTTIAGIPGSGKTTLAVHWAHGVRDRFPDGQLYVNLRGFDPVAQPIAPSEAARAFLDALDVPPSKIPTDLDAQAALYRSLLADKRVLVILDNARDVDQVRPLLPGTSGSIAVITSRNQLSSLIAQGAHPVTVDQLDAHDAGRFLARRLREERTASEPEATARIIDACAGLPLALAIVAARAAAHPDFPLAALAAELHDSNDRLNALADPDPAFDIRAVFSWSYRALAPDTARLIRLLSLHPGPDITAAAAASLAGIAPRQANRLLADLTRANLLVEQSLGRFSFHDLLRVYASERAIAIDSQEDRSEAVGRMLDHYLHSAHAANELIDSTRDPIAIAPFRPHVSPEHPADAEAAMAWFNAERTVLTAAVDRAAAQGFDVQCWQLAWTMPVYLNRRGHWHDQVLASKAAVEAARRLGDTAAQIRALRMLAHAYTRLERFEEAHLLLGRALALSKSLNDRIGQAHILQVHGRLWRLQGRFPEAIACTEKALGLFKASGHREGEASALNSMGWHHALIGDHRAALAYCEQSMIIMQAIGHRSGQATTWHSLGYIDHGLGRHAQAVAHYQRALDLYRELEYRIGEAETLNNLGDTLLAVGDHVAAGRTWRRALVILDGLGHTDAEEVRDKLGGLDVPVDLDRPADGS